MYFVSWERIFTVVVYLIYNLAIMSSVQYLREFINERLTAAAEEIFGVFEKMVVDYEEELDRQRRLLDIAWKPDIKLLRIELPQQHVCKEEEEVLADQQLCVQERNFSVDQEEPEPPEIKEEEEELCSSQEGEQLKVKQETDDFMLTPTYEESDHSEDQSLNLIIDETQNVVEENFINYILVKRSVVSEPNRDHQLLSHNSHAAERQVQEDGKRGDSSSTRNAEQTQPNQHHNSSSHNNNVPNPAMPTFYCNTQTGKMSFKCDTCGKALNCKSALKRHLITHTGERPYSCQTCGKDFGHNSDLIVHMRMHTGEKPYPCNTCGKGFTKASVLKAHIRTHTGERPYSCQTCGKDFGRNSDLTVHMRIHTGEKPFTCKTCGRAFRLIGHLIGHMRTHTGEKPYLCKTCGAAFRHSSHLIGHMRTHTGEKPFICKTCGRAFRLRSHLMSHMNTHTGEKPHSCNTCGKSFCRMSLLKSHVRIHTDDRSPVLATPAEEVTDVIVTL